MTPDPSDDPYAAHFRRPGPRGEAPSPKERADEQFNLLYSELKARAQSLLNRENPGHTLQATALVHEAYMKLAQQDRSALQNQSHALALAAVAMRRILVDHARTRGREKRGGGQHATPLDTNITLAGIDPAFDAIDLLALDAALATLERSHPRHARIVELKFFGGLTNPQVASALGLSLSTIENEWKAARELLLAQLM
jgi:RNA polymerase sigma-70 factor, ECF subfamily